MHESPVPLRLVVVGNGMVGHRLLVSLVETGAVSSMDITVVAGEPRAGLRPRCALVLVPDP